MHDSRLGPLTHRKAPLLGAIATVLTPVAVAIAVIGTNGSSSEIALIWLFLGAPAVLVVAAFTAAAVQRPSLALAALTLCVSAFLHLGVALDLVRGGNHAGILLGVYSVAVLACAAALAVRRSPRTRRLAFGAFLLHVAIGLFGARIVLLGPIGVIAMLEYLSVAAIGLWALHRNEKKRIIRGSVAGDA